MKDRSPISYTFEDIKRYRNGQMSREEMHAFEKASMEDPFLADALEGYMQADMALADEHLENIKESIHDKADSKEKAVVIPMPKKSFAMWRVAAMVIVIAGAGLVTYKALDRKDAGDGTGPVAVIPKDHAAPATQNSALPGDTSTTLASTQGSAPGKTPAVTPVSSNEVGPENKKIGLTAQIKQNDQKDLAINTKKTERANGTLAEEVVVNNTAPSRERSTTANTRQNSNEFRGTILTPSNEPLANTNLQVTNSRKEVVTDDAGNFVLNSRDTVVTATITTGSYANTRLQLRANSNNTINLGDIRLQQDAEFEKSIVVVGLGAKRTKVADTSLYKPVGGWEAFQEHVEKIAKIDSTDYGNDYSTEIAFFVDAKGKPKNIKVLNTTDPEKSKAIIEALKRGPKWMHKNTMARILMRY